MFGELKILFFVWFRSVHGWMWMDVWVNVCLYDTILIVEVVRKAIVARRSWSICWTHLQTFSASTVLGQKASDVEHSRGASAKLPESRLPPHWTGWVLQKGHMFSELRVLFFVCVMSVHGWMGKDVWVNVFTMPFLCADSGKWRTMSRAWPPMSAMTRSLVTTCPSHQESAWWAAKARQESVIVEVVRKGIVDGRC